MHVFMYCEIITSLFGILDTLVVILNRLWAQAQAQIQTMHL